MSDFVSSSICDQNFIQTILPGAVDRGIDALCQQ